LGDFYQLSPPFGHQLWADPDRLDKFNAQGAALYSYFKFSFLNANVSQQGDLRFQDFLNNLRLKQITRSEVDLLNSRVLNRLGLEEQNKFAHATRIFATNLEVEYNRKGH
jgi:hypothetical protein